MSPPTGFDAFLECGTLTHGFVRLRCGDCGHDKLVAYMIDGFRHRFFGTSDVSPWTSLVVVSASLAVVCAVCLHLLRIGYKIRH